MQLVTARSALASAIRIDEDGHNHLLCLKLYEFGIRSLFNVLRDHEYSSAASIEPYSRDDRQLIKHKLNDYIRRSLQIDKLILPDVHSQVAAQIRINDGDTGYDYETLFRKYVTDDVTDLFISDYVNASHQIRNLESFSKMACNSSRKLRSIFVVSRNESLTDVARNQLDTLIKRLRSQFGVELSVQYSESQHDRQIIMNNGFIIKIGFGLDYFKPLDKENRHLLWKYEQRQCKETNVDIFYNEPATSV